MPCGAPPRHDASPYGHAMSCHTLPCDAMRCHAMPLRHGMPSCHASMTRYATSYAICHANMTRHATSYDIWHASMTCHATSYAIWHASMTRHAMSCLICHATACLMLHGMRDAMRYAMSHGICNMLCDAIKACRPAIPCHAMLRQVPSTYPHPHPHPHPHVPNPIPPYHQPAKFQIAPSLLTASDLTPPSPTPTLPHPDGRWRGVRPHRPRPRPSRQSLICR